MLQEELNRANEKAVELQKSLDAERETFAQDKRTLEDAIVDITNAESSSRADSSAREVELRQLEERARVRSNVFFYHCHSCLCRLLKKSIRKKSWRMPNP